MRQFTDDEKEKLNKAKNNINCNPCICRSKQDWEDCLFCNGIKILKEAMGDDWKDFVEGEDFQYEQELISEY